MLSYLAQIDASIFWLFNHYLRAVFLDVLLPIFSQPLLLWVALLFFVAGYVIYCQRQYGDALWRTVVLVMFLGLSVGLADITCNVFKDLAGRVRPHQSLVGTHYYVDGVWHRIAPPQPEQAVTPQASVQKVVEPMPLPVAPDLAASATEVPEQQEGMLLAADTLIPLPNMQQTDLLAEQAGQRGSLQADQLATQHVTQQASMVEATPADLSASTVNAEETPFAAPNPSQVPASDPLMPLPVEPVSRGSSFPSSHAANSMAIATALALLFRRANPWIFLFPIMVGWSRIYMGKHFPFDVISGYVVGVLAVLVIWWFFSLLFFRSIRKPRKLSRLNQQS